MSDAYVTVKRKRVNGHHVFTSDDVTGLYVGAPQPIESLSQVSQAIEALVNLNFSVTVKAEPLNRFCKNKTRRDLAAEDSELVFVLREAGTSDDRSSPDPK